jgi:glycosyltransferase involved in cell wall biosynthesis
LKKTELTLIIPQYNDWNSLNVLLKEIDLFIKSEAILDVQILVVDDCSLDAIQLIGDSFEAIQVNQIRLIKNMGHQRSIAIGLCYAFEHFASEFVCVIDADGEDRPEDLIKLYREAKSNGKSMFAHRGKRSEGFIFKVFYMLYKFIFKLLTGHKVSFGNFSVIKGSILKPLVNDSNLWNNYPASFLKSKIPFSLISTVRGTRYAGESKMNFTQLIIHGLSGVAIFADIVTTRIILFSLLTIFSSIVGIGLVVYIRLTTEMAIPGWATYSVLALAILLFQALLISFFTLFIFLSNRSSLGIKPIKEYQSFLE